MKVFLNMLLLYFYYLIGIYAAVIVVIMLIIFVKWIIVSVYELFKFFFGFFSPVTQWWKYLSKKYRPKKEINLWEVSFAKKKASKFRTYKGFYIPPKKPKEGLSLFFDKKREETENFIKNSQIKNLKKKKKLIKISKKKLSKKILFLKTIYNYYFYQNLLRFPKFFLKKFAHEHLNFANFLRGGQLLLTLHQKKKFNFKYKLTAFTKFKIKKISDLKNLNWFLLNWGYLTENYFMYFLIIKSPMYLIHFNFPFLKIFFLKIIKKFYNKKKFLFLKYFNFKNNSLKYYWSKILISKYLKKTYFNIYFNFLNSFLNKLKNYLKREYFKNILLIFLLKTNSCLLNKFLLIQFQNIFNKLSFIKNILKLWDKSNKKTLLLNFFSRLFGNQIFNIVVNKKKWKKEYNVEVIYNLTNLILQKNILNFNLIYFFAKLNYPLNSKYIKYNLINILQYLNSSLYWFIMRQKLFWRTPNNTFLQLFLDGKKNSNLFINNTKKNTFLFNNLYNFSLKIYSDINSLLNTSYSQQLDVFVKINLINTLFKFLIKKGKKLTAWKVFIKFIKWFKKKYNLPALAIFTHAVLKAEPKIWLKKKKIAGKIYEIPIFISSWWSKSIAIRWLLEYAKKWQQLDIADSLSQEIWDVCFDKGLTINAREIVHTTAKRNKAYMRWF